MTAAVQHVGDGHGGDAVAFEAIGDALLHRQDLKTPNYTPSRADLPMALAS